MARRPRLASKGEPAMTFDPNDPRLTAYLLGELDPADRAEIESMLEDSPEGRQAAEEIRLTVGWLSEQLHAEQAAQSQIASLRDPNQQGDRSLQDSEPVPVSFGSVNHQPIAVPTPSPAAAPRPWWRRKPF